MAVHLRKFHHGPIRYEFRWNSEHHLLHNNSAMSQPLWDYLKNILAGDFPEFYFLPVSGFGRASTRRIRGFPAKERRLLTQQLIQSGAIKELSDHTLTNISHQLLSTSHEDVLAHLLRNDPDSIAIEVPVWSDRLRLTGHIDLVRLNHDHVEIIDYKPAGDFFETLPQITTYAALLLEHLPNLASYVQCLTFNRSKTWIYNPSIIQQVSPRSMPMKKDDDQ